MVAKPERLLLITVTKNVELVERDDAEQPAVAELKARRIEVAVQHAQHTDDELHWQVHRGRNEKDGDLQTE